MPWSDDKLDEDPEPRGGKRCYCAFVAPQHCHSPVCDSTIRLCPICKCAQAFDQVHDAWPCTWNPPLPDGQCRDPADMSSERAMLISLVRSSACFLLIGTGDPFTGRKRVDHVASSRVVRVSRAQAARNYSPPPLGWLEYRRMTRADNGVKMNMKCAFA